MSESLLRDGGVIAAIACETCGAIRGQPCVYVSKNQPWARRIGKPTQRPHWQRITVWSELRKRRERELRNCRINEAAHQLPKGIRDASAARAALVAFDRREANELTCWLREHGHLLTGEGDS